MVMQSDMEFDPFFGGMPQTVKHEVGPEHKYESLKGVMILGCFCSNKSMVELTCHILE